MFPCNLSRKRNNLRNWLIPGLCKCRNKSNFQFWDLEPLTHECVLLASWWVLRPLSLTAIWVISVLPLPTGRRGGEECMWNVHLPRSLLQSERPSNVHVPMMMTEERSRRENTYMICTYMHTGCFKNQLHGCGKHFPCPRVWFNEFWILAPTVKYYIWSWNSYPTLWQPWIIGEIILLPTDEE